MKVCGTLPDFRLARFIALFQPVNSPSLASLFYLSKTK